MNGPAFVQGLLKRVEDKGGVGRPTDPPANNPPGIGVDDKGDIDHAAPRRDIGKVRHPQRLTRSESFKGSTRWEIWA